MIVDELYADSTRESLAAIITMAGSRSVSCNASHANTVHIARCQEAGDIAGVNRKYITIISLS